jgi:hypothetical protein
MTYSVDRDLPLLHRLQQRRLGPRRGPVDLVRQQDVDEHGARPELEPLRVLAVDHDTSHITGQKVGGALNTLQRKTPANSNSAGQQCEEVLWPIARCVDVALWYFPLE